jgi:hypothetical protein
MAFVLQNIKNMLNEQIKDKRKYNIVDVHNDNEPDIEEIKKDTGNVISRKPGKA